MNTRSAIMYPIFLDSAARQTPLAVPTAPGLVSFTFSISKVFLLHCCMPHIATLACGFGMVERILVGWVPDDWSVTWSSIAEIDGAFITTCLISQEYNSNCLWLQQWPTSNNWGVTCSYTEILIKSHSTISIPYYLYKSLHQWKFPLVRSMHYITGMLLP
jgi:hypothetical protein